MTSARVKEEEAEANSGHSKRRLRVSGLANQSGETQVGLGIS
jgi:hypothetical protein